MQGPPDIERLIDSLGATSTREAAADELRLAGKHAVPHLTRALQHRNMYVRMAAAELLGTIGDAAAIPPLIAALDDAEPDVKERVVDAIGHVRNDVSAVPALLRLLSDERYGLRKAALIALANIGEQSTIHAILDGADHSAISTKKAVYVALIGDAVVGDVLSRDLRSSDPNSRRFAIEVLEESQGRSPVDLLELALNDEDTNVQHRIIDALGRAGAGAMPVLERCLNSWHVDSRLRAIAALEGMGLVAVPSLLKAADDQDDATRDRSIEALEGILGECDTVRDVQEFKDMIPSRRFSFGARRRRIDGLLELAESKIRELTPGSTGPYR